MPQATGRWISDDPLAFQGGDANESRYVGNVPVSLLDPSGLAPTFTLKGQQYMNAMTGAAQDDMTKMTKKEEMIENEYKTRMAQLKLDQILMQNFMEQQEAKRQQALYNFYTKPNNWYLWGYGNINLGQSGFGTDPYFLFGISTQPMNGFSFPDYSKPSYQQ